MYLIYLDNELFSTPKNPELMVLEPTLSLVRNGAGELSFQVPPAHPKYNNIVPRLSIFRVYDTREIDENIDILLQNPKFEGFCVEATTSLFKVLTVRCEGTLSFLNDSILRPKHYKGYTTRQLLGEYIRQHNEQVDSFKHFTLGAVTALDSNDYITCFTNYNTTLTEIYEDLLDHINGYIRVRIENNIRYLDFLIDETYVCNQPIELGKNLIDFKSNLSSIDIATCVIPLGAIKETSSIEGLDERVSLKDYAPMNGKDYLISAEAVENFGKIYKIVTFDDVTLPQNLYNKGLKYLQASQFANLVIECKAFDLSNISEEYENFRLNRQVHVKMPSHGLDTTLIISKQDIPLWNPQQETITIGITKQSGISKQSSEISQSVTDAVNKITPASTILKQAYEDATEIMTTELGGTVVKTREKLAIYNAEDEEHATEGWLWNRGGFANMYRDSTGKWAVKNVSITMDGKMVGNEIVGGMIKGTEIQGSRFVVYKANADGTPTSETVFEVDKNGEITATAGKIACFELINLEDLSNIVGALRAETDVYDGYGQRMGKRAMILTSPSRYYAQTHPIIELSEINPYGSSETLFSVSSGGEVSAKKLSSNGDITANGSISAGTTITASGSVLGSEIVSGGAVKGVNAEGYLYNCAFASGDLLFYDHGTHLAVYSNGIFQGNLTYAE